ncbi:MAG: hypothetical protein U1F43_07890 [Myxococcota bacterium]
MKLGWIAAMALAASACGKKEGGGGGGGGDAPAAKLPANAVADANAAVPKELQAKLEFVEGSYDERNAKALAVVPKGWTKSDVIPGMFKPPDGANMGFMTKFSVGSNCDGSCEAKDWAATADKVEFAQFAGAGFKVDKDEKGAGMRVLVASGDDGQKYVAAAFWKDGASRYYSCRASLERDDAAFAPAFEKACRALTPVW